MFSVGETLRQARLKQSLDLCAVAARTKINIKYLEAIEADRRESLPSGFFYRSFVDQYAKSLSLDTQQIDAEVNRLLSVDAPLPLPCYEHVVSQSVSPMKSRGFHSWRMYVSLAALLLMVTGGAGVYTLWRDSRSSLSVQAVIDNVRSFAKAPPIRMKLPARVKPTKPVTGVPLSPAPVYVETAATQPIAESDKVTLDLRAIEPTWVSVSSDGNPVFSGILQPNESKTVAGKESAKIRTGNAAGIEVRLNGKLLAPLGARGQVMIVLFTPDNVQILPPPKESD